MSCSGSTVTDFIEGYTHVSSDNIVWGQRYRGIAISEIYTIGNLSNGCMAVLSTLGKQRLVSVLVVIMDWDCTSSDTTSDVTIPSVGKTLRKSVSLD